MRSVLLMLIVSCFILCLGDDLNLHAQCPENGETKVVKPSKGIGYYFYKFMGSSSFVYFLDGKKFSYNDQDNPGKTYIFIDDFAYEPLWLSPADLADYVHSSNESDILRAQAKHAQEHFKEMVPSLRIKDYGVSVRQNADGSNGRLFYLWRKESAPGSQSAPQYLVSTVVNRGVAALSFMPLKASVSEDEIFSQIRTYTSHFDAVSADWCAKVLSAPTAP